MTNHEESIIDKLRKKRDSNPLTLCHSEIEQILACFDGAREEVEEIAEEIIDSNVSIFMGPDHIQSQKKRGWYLDLKRRIVSQLTAERRRAETAEDTLDLFVDEFKRIKSCDSANDEIKWICQRAIENLVQKVPMIVQRDNAEKKVAELESRLQEAEREIRDKSLLLDLAETSAGKIKEKRAKLEKEVERLQNVTFQMSGWNKKDFDDKIKELEARLEEVMRPPTDDEIRNLLFQNSHYKELQSLLTRYKGALERITEVSQFGRDGGPVVQSEHYEGAWLDCVEIAKDALSPSWVNGECWKCNGKGMMSFGPHFCPVCNGTGKSHSVVKKEKGK